MRGSVYMNRLDAIRKYTEEVIRFAYSRGVTKTRMKELISEIG